ncbi:Cytochrome c [Planctomycetes bacterium Pan216]|uniref:Cytochrome c n=1 Tax=Kolteria novifilia TaxID=2527975 RepID=A0A518B5Y2_9BACT|nr:Cytochrome c [Planctomycetes bacterium Pan216]
MSTPRSLSLGSHSAWLLLVSLTLPLGIAGCGGRPAPTPPSAEAPKNAPEATGESDVVEVVAQETMPEETDSKEPAKPDERFANDVVRDYADAFKGRGAVSDMTIEPKSPEETHESFTLMDGLAVDVAAHEPDVRQPVFLNFDERGRMWVMQYLQYPFPEGLKITSYDKHLRAQFDRVPSPPPNHTPGADKITIHEDTDGDGIYDDHKTFVDGLNIATSMARGRGGVWVLNPPYLLFYPDKNNDDVPDGDPEVHLAGFGLEDTHAVANSLRWGPDGWLYGAQGSTVWATVKRPGIDDEGVHFKGQAIWRYDPATKRFEVFAEGGGNTFCVEFDAKGRCFSGHNGGNTRGFHYVQGGYYRKSWGKHGPLTNPNAFGFFEAMKHAPAERFSHTIVVYEGDSLPEAYRNTIIAPVPLHHYVAVSNRDGLGSTFQTKDFGHLVESKDQWFRPVDIKAGPDGAVYLADWYDTRLTHVDPRDTWDRARGRIYRIRDAKKKAYPKVDLGSKSSEELVRTLSHPNKWHRQTALRLLGDRKDQSVIPSLKKLMAGDDDQAALEALWALYQIGAFDEALALEGLKHRDPHVRRWTIRLLGDDNTTTSSHEKRLVTIAETEKDPEVLSQLASTAKRLPSSIALPIIETMLSRDELAKDPHLPLLLWWALEEKASTDREGVIALLQDPARWQQPLIREQVIGRLGQRYAAERSMSGLETCARLLALAPDNKSSERIINGMEEGLAGNRITETPSSLDEALAKRWQQGTPSLNLIRLRCRLGSEDAIDAAVKILKDGKAPLANRLSLLDLFAEQREPKVVPILLELLESEKSSKLRQSVLTSLRRYQDPRIPGRLVELVATKEGAPRDEALSILVSRPEWGKELIAAVETGSVKPSSVAVSHLLQLKGFGDSSIDEAVTKHWGKLTPSSEEKNARVKEVRTLLAKAIDKGDRTSGRHLFKENCAKCHTLFQDRGQVGPNLTGYERGNFDFMIPAVIDPSLAIREEFTSYKVVTSDGQVLAGVVVEDTPASITLSTPEGTRVVLPREDIDEIAASSVSIMPEGLLDKMSDQQILDLFAYLQGTEPVRN